MLNKFAIKVQETIIDRASGNSASVDGYFERFENDRLDTRPRVVESSTFNSIEEAESVIEELPVRHCGTYLKKYEYSVEPITYTHANKSGWSDMYPYEIVKVISPKTIEIRAMDCEQDPEFTPEFISGGFAGHCVNQGQQKWIYSSNPENGVIRARLRKDGYFHSRFGRHILDDEPVKFYDYNLIVS